jgi:APA family basic amino acid/polyamine antiporter
MTGAGDHLFCLHWFDAVSTTAEETRNPQRDLPIGMIASLIICTVIYVLTAGVTTGLKKWSTICW